MLRIVLVEPREAGNVGAAARVMKNFGFRELVIAGSHPQLDPVAGWWASGADDVVRASRRVPTLHEAIADARLVVATTSTRGRSALPALTPAEVAQMYATLGAEETLALVFGREDSGLTNDEIALCARTAAIPTDAAFPTMNLAQAVGMFCYELSAIVAAPNERGLARAEDLERLHSRIEALLAEVGFLRPGQPDHIYDEIRALAARSELDSREVTILLGIVRQIEWKLRQ